MQSLRNILAPTLAVLFVFSVASVPFFVEAQDAQTCNAPAFEITSDSQIYALTGDQFSYFVVTDTDAAFSLESALPTGLSYANGRISGVPTAEGAYNLRFAASDECGTTSETITLTVVESESSVAQTDTGAGDQGASAGEVGLDEIPETGVDADQLLTIGFYMLGLLAVVGWGANKFATASGSAPSRGDTGNEFDTPNYALANPDKDSAPRRFGDGIRR